MANVSVYNTDGQEVGKIDLNDAVFGVEVNEHLVHMAVVAQLANKRQGTQKAKTRSEVSGGEGCQVPFRPPIPNVRLLLRRCSGKGLHLAMTGEPRGFLTSLFTASFFSSFSLSLLYPNECPYLFIPRVSQ